jgi:hypothetical protein
MKSFFSTLFSRRVRPNKSIEIMAEVGISTGAVG